MLHVPVMHKADDAELKYEIEEIDDDGCNGQQEEEIETESLRNVGVERVNIARNEVDLVAWCNQE